MSLPERSVLVFLDSCARIYRLLDPGVLRKTSGDLYCRAKIDYAAQHTFFLEKEDDPSICIWEMHAAILLIIFEDLIK